MCDQLLRWATKCHFYNERNEIKCLQIGFGPSKGLRCVVNANECNILPHTINVWNKGSTPKTPKSQTCVLIIWSKFWGTKPYPNWTWFRLNLNNFEKKWLKWGHIPKSRPMSKLFELYQKISHTIIFLYFFFIIFN